MRENDSMISSIRTTILWPYLEVLDFTYNKLNDFYEVLHILNGGIIRKELLKIIAIKGNQFYNYYNFQNTEAN